jgi:hypothetical protein
VRVAPDRVTRWFENFEAGHGGASYDVDGGALHAVAQDGSTAVAQLPFDRAYTGEKRPEAFAGAVTVPERWGLLLVRKGGFAVARLAQHSIVEHKIGQRHVQGRTKAGGQSQQRFARRRDNQARAAYGAAADHAARILGHRLDALVVGGDQGAVDAVLADPRLRAVADRRRSVWLAVGDPRRAVLDQAVVDSCAVLIDVTNA